MTDSDSPDSSKRKLSKGSKRPSFLGPVVGVEIGHSTIYMVRLRKAAEGNIVLEKCQSFSFDPSLDVKTLSFSSILKGALKEFVGSSKEHVIWVASPKLDQTRLHHIKIPKVNSTRLSGAVYWGLQREETFVEEETVVDFQVEEGAESKSTLNVSGAIIARECIEEVQQGFSQAGYSLTGIGVPLFALRNLVNRLSEERQEAPVLICQLGHSATSVSVLLNDQLVFTRNIPLGLQSFAEILIKELDTTLSEEEACELVLKLGVEKETLSPDEGLRHEKALALLHPALERKVRQIQRTIEYYQSNFNTEPMETIFLGGEITARGYLFDFLSGQLSTQVIAIDPFETPDLQAKGGLPEDKGERIAYGPAFGLALEGSQAGINLAHTYKERESEKKNSKLSLIVTILLLLLTVAVTLFYNSQRLTLRDLDAQKNNLEKSLNDLGPRLTGATVSKAMASVRTLQKRRREATKRYEGLALLSEITRLTPENISLLHISAAMGSAITFLDATANRSDPVEGVATERGTLRLRGLVSGERTSLETSLTIYIARLDQSGLFRKVEVKSTELVESLGNKYLTFTLNLRTVEDLIVE